MPDIFYLISKWWKQMLAIVAISLIAVGLVVFLQEKQYLAVATALPVNSLNADKSKVFGGNAQALYPSIGAPDELDKILGTAQLDTVYLAIARKFDLADHYKVKEMGNAGIYKAATLLKKNSNVIKSDYGELKIKTWDTDKQLAPQLANAIMAELDSIHQHIQNENNYRSLLTIREAQARTLAGIDSLERMLNAGKPPTESMQYIIARNKTLADQLDQYEKLIGQYEVMLNSNPSVLAVVEKARVANWPDKPKRLEILVATAFLSLVFAFLLALMLERKKQ